MFSMAELRSTLPSVQSGLQLTWGPEINRCSYSQNKSHICKCGDVGNLTKPCFPLTKGFNSLVVAVGHLIYVFGGYSKTKVSYIDTRCQKNGWKIYKSQIPKGRNQPYPITLVDKNNNIESVLLVGGLACVPHEDHYPFGQMYYPPCEQNKDRWVVIESEPDEYPSLFVFGHAVFQEKGQRIVLMHDFRSPKLFTYTIEYGKWGIRWDGELGQNYRTSALVGRIYYVLDCFRRERVSILLEYEHIMDGGPKKQLMEDA